jgi:DNA-binding PadR family transcriptional regulator
MEQKWIETETTIETVNWKGEPMKIAGVKAFKNPKTGAIMVYPFEVTKAEIRQIAECFDLQPRDVATLLMIAAKPGIFKEGEVFYKYHLQKQLFYLWKTLEICGYGDPLPMDNFISADNGPKPEHLDKDLQRLEERKLITVRREKWDNHESKRITLTKEGEKTAEKIWAMLPEPYKETAIRVKERIHPLSPEKVRHLVHKEYPEYRNTYVKNDIE